MRFVLFLFFVVPLSFTGVLFFADSLGLVEVDWNMWFSIPSTLLSSLCDSIDAALGISPEIQQGTINLNNAPIPNMIN